MIDFITTYRDTFTVIAFLFAGYIGYYLGHHSGYIKGFQNGRRAGKYHPTKVQR